MGRLIASIALALLLLFACVWSEQTVTGRTDEIAAAVESGDVPAALSRWQASQPVFGALLEHDELDETDRLLRRLAHLQQQGGESAEQALTRAELLDQLHRLPEQCRPSLRNVL